MGMLVLCLFLTGCGGGGSSGGGSLSDQYRKAMQITNPTARVTQLLAVATRQDQAGDMFGADQSLASAAAAAESIEDAKGRAIALNRVASDMARMGRRSDAKNLLKGVRKACDGIDDPETKVPVLTRMSYMYGKYLDAPDIASAYLKNCEEIAETISRPEGRIEAMLEVAYTHFGLGDEEKTQGLIDQSLEAARALEDARKRADSIANAAATLSKMKKTEEAKTVFQEAQAKTDEIEDPLSQAHALVHLGDKLIESGFTGAAQKILEQAEDVADTVTDASMRRPLMDKIFAARRRL
jgi:tetratricopeptide (TPR) repeat protein